MKKDDIYLLGLLGLFMWACNSPYAAIVGAFCAMLTFFYFMWQAACNASTIKSKAKLIEYVELLHNTGGPYSPECQQFCYVNVDDADFSRRAKLLNSLILKLRPETE